MSPIMNAPYYWCECDVCGQPQEDGDYAAWKQEDHAAQLVRDSDGLVQRYWLPTGTDHADVVPIIVCGRCTAKYIGGLETDEDPDGAERELELLDRDDAAAEARLEAWIAEQQRMRPA